MGTAIVAIGLDCSNLNLGQVTPLQDIPATAIAIAMNSSYSGTTFTPAITYTPTNSNKKGVTWSITAGGTYATINSTTGVVTILSTANASNVTIQAVSNYDNSIIATATTEVTYNETVDTLTSISISGDANVTGTATYSVTYNPTNTSKIGVVWSIISGSVYATIDSSTGKLTSLNGADSSEVIVKATSTYDSGITATKTVTVTHVAIWDGLVYSLSSAFTNVATTTSDADCLMPRIKLSDTNKDFTILTKITFPSSSTYQRATNDGNNTWIALITGEMSNHPRLSLSPDLKTLNAVYFSKADGSDATLPLKTFTDAAYGKTIIAGFKREGSIFTAFYYDGGTFVKQTATDYTFGYSSSNFASTYLQAGASLYWNGSNMMNIVNITTNKLDIYGEALTDTDIQNKLTAYV